MPSVDLFGNPIDEPYGQWGPPDIPNGVNSPANPPGAFNPADHITPIPGTNPNTGGSGGNNNASPSPSNNGFDVSKVPSGIDPAWAQDFINRNPGDYSRLASAFGSQRTGGASLAPPLQPDTARIATSAPTGYNPGTSQAPPFQFNDPYTKLYEDVAQKNLASLQGQNDQVKQLMDFINKQFQTYSKSPGYSPDELAVLNAQMFSPIEANRQASQQRTLERASARGVLPSSGIVQDEQRLNDVNFDQQRAAGSRDVAINAITKRQQDLASALNLAQLGVTIPDQRDAQALSVANSLYQIPRQAMLDAEGVINGSSPTAALSPLIQLMQLGQQNSQFNQQQSQQQRDALMQQLGLLFAGIFGGK